MTLSIASKKCCTRQQCMHTRTTTRGCSCNHPRRDSASRERRTAADAAAAAAAAAATAAIFLSSKKKKKKRLKNAARRAHLMMRPPYRRRRQAPRDCPPTACECASCTLPTPLAARWGRSMWAGPSPAAAEPAWTLCARSEKKISGEASRRGKCSSPGLRETHTMLSTTKFAFLPLTLYITHSLLNTC